jgi:hypothetical protein
MPCYTNPMNGVARVKNRSRHGPVSLDQYVLLIALACILIGLPQAAGAVPDNSTLSNATAPQVVQIGVYVVDFNKFDVADGTLETNFYLTLKSDSPVSFDDFEIMNGHATSVDTLLNTSHEKYYRVFATITADPDLRRYPFDRHTLPIEIEPKLLDVNRMVLVIHGNSTGLDPGSDLPGWQFADTGAYSRDHSYGPYENPYSRAFFNYNIGRDTASTLLKFFLPIMLIVIVSLFSLMMKVSSRLGLNASMLLAAVMIHWRIADAIPLVAYATFLDIFMIITYGTLAMVLLSGILLMKLTELKDTARVEKVYFWSLRIIPAVSITAYFLLVLSLLL